MIDLPLEPPQTSEQVIEQRLIECGLDAYGISVKYEDYLQSIEIVITPSAGATPDHFRCINDAVGHEIVTFEDREMSGLYHEFVSALMRPGLLAEAKTDLRERGLLDGFPDRKNHEALACYLRALEEHAGVRPGSALKASGNNIIFDPPREEKEPMDFVERYFDLLAIVRFVSLRDRMSFGWIGNEKIRGQ